MKRGVLSVVGLLLLINCSPSSAEEIPLPEPMLKGRVSVEEAIHRRRSIRTYEEGTLTLEEVSQLVWSAVGLTIDGLTGPTRSHPSAGGLYPLEVLLVVGEVESLEPGIYRYDPLGHRLFSMRRGDHREDLRSAALGQSCISEAPLDLVLTAIFGRTTGKYGGRGERYVLIDLGAAIQNLYLQAESLGLGLAMIGAFYDERVEGVLGTEGEVPLAIIPVGRR